MRVFVYDKDTKEFLRSQDAQPNPKKPGEFLIPANSTLEQLPDFSGDNETLVFSDNGWVVVKDFRGKLVIDLNSLEILSVNYLGEIKDGFQIIDEDTRDDFLDNPDAYAVVDGVFTCIRGTVRYAQILKDEFDKAFIETNLGYVRINTAWGNFLTIKPNYDMQVNLLGYLPENVMILYKCPNFNAFSDYRQVESWLQSKGQFKNERVELEQYNIFSAQILERFTSEVAI